jgi:hypothetical protein
VVAEEERAAIGITRLALSGEIVFPPACTPDDPAACWNYQPADHAFIAARYEVAGSDERTFLVRNGWTLGNACGGEDAGDHAFVRVGRDGGIRYSMPIQICFGNLSRVRRGDQILLESSGGWEKGSSWRIDYEGTIAGRKYVYDLRSGELTQTLSSWSLPSTPPAQVDRLEVDPIQVFAREHDAEVVRECHLTAFDGGGGDSPDVQIVLKIARDGHVLPWTDPWLRGEQRRAQECVTKIARQWTFPSSGAITVVTVLYQWWPARPSTNPTKRR